MSAKTPSLSRVPRARLKLAARLGHRGARRLVPGQALVSTEGFGLEALTEVLNGLHESAPERVRLGLSYAADCVEPTLPIFEKKHPRDKSVRVAFDAARAWVAGTGSVEACLRAYEVLATKLTDAYEGRGGPRSIFAQRDVMVVVFNASSLARVPTLPVEEAFRVAAKVACYSSGPLRKSSEKAFQTQLRRNLARLGDYVLGRAP